MIYFNGKKVSEILFANQDIEFVYRKRDIIFRKYPFVKNCYKYFKIDMYGSNASYRYAISDITFIVGDYTATESKEIKPLTPADYNTKNNLTGSLSYVAGALTYRMDLAVYTAGNYGVNFAFYNMDTKTPTNYITYGYASTGGGVNVKNTLFIDCSNFITRGRPILGINFKNCVYNGVANMYSKWFCVYASKDNENFDLILMSPYYNNFSTDYLKAFLPSITADPTGSYQNNLTYSNPYDLSKYDDEPNNDFILEFWKGTAAATMFCIKYFSFILKTGEQITVSNAVATSTQTTPTYLQRGTFSFKYKDGTVYNFQYSINRAPYSADAIYAMAKALNYGVYWITTTLTAAENDTHYQLVISGDTRVLKGISFSQSYSGAGYPTRCLPNMFFKTGDYQSSTMVTPVNDANLWQKYYKITTDSTEWEITTSATAPVLPSI